MTVTITLTTAGINIGTCNLYSNTDGYVTPFATGITRSQLLIGYTSSAVPAGTSTVRVISSGICSNYVDIPVVPLPTTTTTTFAPVGYIYICNNFFSGQITDVTVDGVSIIGASFPLNIGDCTSGATTSIGFSQTVRIYYSGIYTTSSINLSDGYYPVTCDAATGSYVDFLGVYISNGGTCNITGNDGLCY